MDSYLTMGQYFLWVTKARLDINRTMMDVTVLNPEQQQKTSFLPTQLLTLNRTSTETRTKQYEISQPSGLFFLDLPHLNSPRAPTSLLLRNGRGREGRAPRMSPLTASSGRQLEVRASFLPARVPTVPASDSTTTDRFLGRTAEAARRTLACPPPGAALAAQARCRGVTGPHRGHPSSGERPPRPLRSAPPPADGAPGLTSPGKRKRPETGKQSGPTEIDRKDCACVRTRARPSHLPSAEPAAPVT